MKNLVIAIIVTFLFAPAFSIAGKKLISKQEFGNKWPFSVGKGIVECKPIGKGAIVFKAKGITYALNGIARGISKKYGYSQLDSIWKDDPGYHQMLKEIAKSENKSIKDVAKIIGPATKVRIRPILDIGASLCH